MKDYKFFESRKVVILQQINSTQSLVQEVFLNESGEDVIAKEPFVVNICNLTDSPLTSYKVGKLKQYEIEYEKLIKEWSFKIESKEIELKNAYNKVYHLTKSLQILASNLSNENRIEFMRLLDFMSGAIKWVVYDEYDIPVMIPFKDIDIYSHDDGVIDGIKLITLFGMCDGNLQYRINSYRDGSGSWKHAFFYCEEHEALEKFKELLISKNISEKVIETAKLYKITLDENKVNEWYVSRREYLQKEIDKQSQYITNLKENLENIPNKI